ncbi:pilus assembly protein [Sandarakinorhabdus sp.]|uniref:TadE/TadG family type IV pilus assembly protein n=1 Tax=Sandarakinorhabdus sp. TaxID=1916663 RepID=UPI00286EB4A8|nr:pilus assembly protein [Sandarakinorhabdus sp.]
MKIRQQKRGIVRRDLGSQLNLGRSGAVAAEFALIVPLMATMMFGVLQFGFAIYTVNAMETAARTGARQMVFGTNFAVAEAATRAALPGWVASGATVSSVVDDDGLARMTVTVPGSSAAILGLVPMPENFTAHVAMPRVNDRSIDDDDDGDDGDDDDGDDD